MGADPKDLGILFRGDMVRAILAGAKTVTRRAIRINPKDGAFYLLDGWPHRSLDGEGNRVPGMEEPYPCRYAVGRRLWVRETWAPHPTETQDPPEVVVYRADRAAWGADPHRPAHVNRPKPSMDLDRDPTLAEPRWRPSLLMPRWASRLTLVVTDVRAERLTEITAEDVALEGFVHAGLGDTAADYCREYRAMHKLAEDADPWLWRVAFDVVEVSDGR